jgi:hypothetical protein
MKIDKTPFSWMAQFRLFGIDFIFGYMKIKEAAETAEDSSADDVNLIMKRK